MKEDVFPQVSDLYPHDTYNLTHLNYATCHCNYPQDQAIISQTLKRLLNLIIFEEAGNSVGADFL